MRGRRDGSRHAGSRAPEATAVSLRTDDGVALAARFWNPTAGTGDDRRLACVVAHGFTGSSGKPQIRHICRTLAARGLAVLAPDFRGHGRSGGLGTAGADEIHDLAAAVRWLRGAGYVRVAVLGWSMGGTAVLRHAGLGGDADAVVSVSAPGTWWERGTRPMRVVHWMFESRTGRTATHVLRRTRLARDTWDPTPEPPADVVGAISPRPLLIVHGDADHYFPMTHVEALAAAAPDADVWRETGMGHAEAATTDELLERVGTWVLDALRAGPDDGRTAASRTPVCDDGDRD